MEDFKADRARARAEVIARLGHIPYREHHPMGQHYDISSVDIPSVRFVQVRSLPQKKD